MDSRLVRVIGADAPAARMSQRAALHCRRGKKDKRLQQRPKRQKRLLIDAGARRVHLVHGRTDDGSR